MHVVGDLVDRYSSLLEDVQESQVVLIDDTKAAHNLLIDLQNVLLNGEDEEDQKLEISESSTNHEQVSCCVSKGFCQSSGRVE